jgi:hypothetical protein
MITTLPRIPISARFYFGEGIDIRNAVKLVDILLKLQETIDSDTESEIDEKSDTDE